MDAMGQPDANSNNKKEKRGILGSIKDGFSKVFRRKSQMIPNVEGL